MQQILAHTSQGGFRCVDKHGKVLTKLHVSALHFIILRRPVKASWGYTALLSWVSYPLVSPEVLPSTHRASPGVSEQQRGRGQRSWGSIFSGKDTVLIIWLLRSDRLILKLGFIRNILHSCMWGTLLLSFLNLFERGNSHTVDRRSPLPSSAKVFRVSSMPARSLTPSITVLPPILV